MKSCGIGAKTIYCTCERSCFTDKNATFRGGNKDWLAQRQDNMSRKSDMSCCGLFLPWFSILKIWPSILINTQQVSFVLRHLYAPILNTYCRWTFIVNQSMSFESYQTLVFTRWFVFSMSNCQPLQPNLSHCYWIFLPEKKYNTFIPDLYP